MSNKQVVKIELQFKKGEGKARSTDLRVIYREMIIKPMRVHEVTK